MKNFAKKVLKPIIKFMYQMVLIIQNITPKKLF